MASTSARKPRRQTRYMYGELQQKPSHQVRSSPLKSCLSLLNFLELAIIYRARKYLRVVCGIDVFCARLTAFRILSFTHKPQNTAGCHNWTSLSRQFGLVWIGASGTVVIQMHIPVRNSRFKPWVRWSILVRAKLKFIDSLLWGWPDDLRLMRECLKSGGQSVKHRKHQFCALLTSNCRLYI